MNTDDDDDADWLRRHSHARPPGKPSVALLMTKNLFRSEFRAAGSDVLECIRVIVVIVVNPRQVFRCPAVSMLDALVSDERPLLDDGDQQLHLVKGLL